MKLSSSRAYISPTPVPKMPAGLSEIMEGLTKEVLKNNPNDIFEFCAEHMRKLLEIRDGRPPDKFLSLEQKIVNANNIIKQRAKQRRIKYDRDFQLYLKQDNLLRYQESEKEKKMLEIVHHNDGTKGFLKSCGVSQIISDFNENDISITKNEEGKLNSCMVIHSKNNEDEHIHEKIHDEKNEVYIEGSYSDKHIMSDFDFKNDVMSLTNELDLDTDTDKVKDGILDVARNENLKHANINDSFKNDHENKEMKAIPLNIEISQEDQSNDKQGDMDNGKLVNVPNNLNFDQNISDINVISVSETDSYIDKKANSDFIETEEVTKKGSDGCIQIKQKYDGDENNDRENAREDVNLVIENPGKGIIKEDQSIVKIINDEMYDIKNHNCIEKTDAEFQSKEIILVVGIDEVEKEKEEDFQNIQIETENKHDTDSNLTVVSNSSNENTVNKSVVIEGQNNVIHQDSITNLLLENKFNSNENCVNLLENKINESTSIKDELEIGIKNGNTNNCENITIVKVPDNVNDKVTNTIVENIDQDINNVASNPSQINADENSTQQFIKSKTQVNEEFTNNITEKSKAMSIELKNECIDNSSVKLEREDGSDDNQNIPNEIQNNNNENQLTVEPKMPKTMDLETAAITIQKVFRNFLFKSKTSSLDDSNIEYNVLELESDIKDDNNYAKHNPNVNKDRRTLGLNRMDTVLQTVNEEKSLSLSTDDSSTLSSAATIIQARIRGFLVRNRFNRYKTSSSLRDSDDPSTVSLEAEPDPSKNKTVLNIHIVPEGGHFMSRDESLLTSVELSLDGSPPASTNLHPLGYDISERRKQLKREDAIQSISPPSNNSGRLSEEHDSIKELCINDENIEAEQKEADEMPIGSQINVGNDGNLISSKAVTVIVQSEDQNIKSTSDIKYVAVSETSCDESDVITPFVPTEEKNNCDSDNTKLLHSGEFHDVLLPTKVSRSDTSVVRDFQNVLVYFLVWNNSL